MPTMLLLSPTAATVTSITDVLLSGAVGGVIVALISHGFTRNRAREEWLRDKLFEVTDTLMDAHKAFQKACQDAPTTPGVVGTEYGAAEPAVMGIPGSRPDVPNVIIRKSEARRMLDAHDWSDLDTAMEAYLAALSKVGLLIRNYLFHHKLSQLEIIMRYAQSIVRLPYPEWGDDAEVDWNDFDFRANRHLSDLDHENRKLVNQITENYFATKKGRRWELLRPWVKYPRHKFNAWRIERRNERLGMH